MDKSTTSANTELVLKDSVIELAKKIEAGLTIDKKTGVGNAEDGLYKANLPEGLDMNTVKLVSNYNADFVAAGAFAFGKMAVDTMAKDKSLTKCTAEIKMAGRDSVTHNVDRRREYTNHLGNGEKTEKFGVVTSIYEVKAGKNSGALKTARALVAEMAFKKLK